MRIQNLVLYQILLHQSHEIKLVQSVLLKKTVYFLGEEKKQDRTKRRLLLSHMILTGVFKLRCAQLTANVMCCSGSVKVAFRGKTNCPLPASAGIEEKTGRALKFYD